MANDWNAIIACIDCNCACWKKGTDGAIIGIMGACIGGICIPIDGMPIAPEGPKGGWKPGIM